MQFPGNNYGYLVPNDLIIQGFSGAKIINQTSLLSIKYFATSLQGLYCAVYFNNGK
jgi:hypothetical protein